MIPTISGAVIGGGFGALLLNNEPAAIMIGFAIGWSAGAFSHLCSAPVIPQEKTNKKDEEADIEMALPNQNNWSDRLSNQGQNLSR